MLRNRMFALLGLLVIASMVLAPVALLPQPLKQPLPPKRRLLPPKRLLQNPHPFLPLVMVVGWMKLPTLL